MPAWQDFAMLTSFSSYRPRRLLPFAAAYALVFINGSTLAPLVLPGPWATACRAHGGSASDAATSPAEADDDRRGLHYERAEGESPEQTAITAPPPPIVKNLRRSMHVSRPECASHRLVWRYDVTPGLDAEFLQRALAAKAADLTRLCRRLL